MKKIYICHEFGGESSNVKKVRSLMVDLIKKNPNNVYISPILLYKDVYYTVPYDIGMEYCISILKDCDEMITFGDWSNSKGCLIEKEFCKNNNIKITDFSEFIKEESIL